MGVRAPWMPGSRPGMMIEYRRHNAHLSQSHRHHRRRTCRSLPVAGAGSGRRRSAWSKRWATTISSNRCRAPGPIIPPRWKCSIASAFIENSNRAASSRRYFITGTGTRTSSSPPSITLELKNDTRFPYVLQCERIKIVEEALKMAKAHPNIDLAAWRPNFSPSRRMADGVTARVRQSGGRGGNDRRPLSCQRRGRAQHRAQGPRHRVRGFYLRRPHAEHRSRLRFHAARLCAPQLHFRSGRVVEPVPLERAAGPLARAFPDRSRRPTKKR